MIKMLRSLVQLSVKQKKESKTKQIKNYFFLNEIKRKKKKRKNGKTLD